MATRDPITVNVRTSRDGLGRFLLQALLLTALASLLGCVRGLAAPDRSVPVPPGWTAMTLSDSEAELGWQAALPAEARARQFFTFRLTRSVDARAAGRASCQWQFRLRRDAPPVAEVASTAVPIPASDALSLWIKNPGGHTARLRMKVTDADGVEYLSPEVALGEERNWYELVFNLSEFACADPPRGVTPGPRFPLRGLGLLLSDLQPERDYTFFLDELRSRRAPLAKLDVIELVTPRKVPAGQDVPVRFRLRALSAISSDLEVSVSLCMNGVPAGARLFRVPVAAGGHQPGDLLPPCQGTITLPSLVAAGDYEVCFASDRAEIAVPGPDRLATSIVGVVRDDPSRTTSSTEHSEDIPVLRVRGEPLQEIFALPDVNDDRALAVMADARPQAVRFRVTIGTWERGAACVTWPARERLEFADLDRVVRRVLASAPEALLVPELVVGCPRWWADENPAELEVVMGESGDKKRHERPSFASISWRQDAGEALAATLNHLENGPFADHIAAYQISSGLEGRWLPWWLDRDGIGDYSAPARVAFQGWVRDKYGTLEDFRAAWGEPTQPAVGRPGAVPATLSWGAIHVPPAKQRLRHRAWLLDPVSYMPVVDYRLFASRAALDMLDGLLMRTKTVLEGRKACGVAYGHFMELSTRRLGMEEGGHLALGPALALQSVDFLVGPPMAQHVGALLMPAASVHRANKVLLPSLADPGPMAPEAVAAAYEQAMPACLGPNSGDVALARWPTLTDPGSTAQVAVVVDDLSAAYFGQGNPVGRALLAEQMVELRRLGAPVDVWLLDDLLQRRAPAYRMYLFLNVFRLGPASMRTLLDSLPNRGEVRIWFCAPGGLGTTFNGKLMRSLTGIATSVSMQGGAMDVRLGALAEGPLADPVPANLSYGLPGAIAPIFQVIASDAEVLGTDQQGNATLVRKRQESHTSVYSVAPNMPAGLLRHFARQAGVHIYSEAGDRVYANRSFLAVATDIGGRRLIRLPQRADVYELPSRASIASNADEFVLELPERGVRLLALKPPGTEP